MPYRVTPTGVQMFVDGEWIAVPDYAIQYRALPGDTGETAGGIGAGLSATGMATGSNTQPSAPSFRQTQQRLLDRPLHFVRAISGLFHKGKALLRTTRRLPNVWHSRSSVRLDSGRGSANPVLYCALFIEFLLLSGFRE